MIIDSDEGGIFSSSTKSVKDKDDWRYTWHSAP